MTGLGGCCAVKVATGAATGRSYFWLDVVVTGLGGWCAGKVVTAPATGACYSGLIVAVAALGGCFTDLDVSKAEPVVD